MQTQKTLRGYLPRRFLVLVLAGGACAVLTAPVLLGGDGASPAPPQAISQAESISAAFRDAAKTISPSVVNITMVDRPDNVSFNQQQPQLRFRRQQVPDEFFRRFFGDGQGDVIPFNIQPQPAPERRGQGSGVIIKSDGYILTNNHVVQGADELHVKLSDGHEYPATVVGTDPDSDLAVVKIDATGLPAAKFGDSDALQQGDWVVAVGNPFGLDHTVTAGVVSAKGRGNIGLNTYEDFIQTDAAINPGNSGGPLVNLRGEMVGINSAIHSSTGGSDGIGFAIPSNLAQHVAQSLMDDGRVDRGWIGVGVQPLTPDLASAFNYTGSTGVVVTDVMDGTPAQESGLQSGDIIVEVDRRPIDSPRALVNTIGQREPGDRIRLTVARNGSEQVVPVTLALRPGEAQVTSTPQASQPQSSLGLAVQPLNEDLRQQLGISAGSGLLVTDVQSGSAADRAGLQPEDVIVEANHSPVSSARDLANQTRDLSKGVLLKIDRGGRALYMVIKN